MPPNVSKPQSTTILGPAGGARTTVLALYFFGVFDTWNLIRLAGWAGSLIVRLPADAKTDIIAPFELMKIHSDYHRIEQAIRFLDTHHLARPLLVTFEGVTPGEMKARGAGVVIRHGQHDSPFGPCLIGLTDRGICALHFGQENPEALLASDWPRAKLVPDKTATADLLGRIFGKRNEDASGLRVFLRGTSFQLAVWRALLRVPSGSVTTYRAIAQAVGNSRASRAVGGAVGANPVAWLIPCHRVLRASGGLGGYRWGTERKTAMIFRESVGNAARPIAEEPGLP